MKRCCACRVDKEECFFGKNKATKDGLEKRCKQCRRDYALRTSEKNYARVKKRVTLKSDDVKRYQRNYYQQNKDRLSIVNKKYYVNNKPKIMELAKVYIRERRKVDLQFKIKHCLRSRIQSALNGSLKIDTTLNLIGCDILKLKEHLASLFNDGMNWDNYGEWHIDHIKPCARFNLSDTDQQKECFHYTNLQPLWAIDNLKKSDKWDRF